MCCPASEGSAGAPLRGITLPPRAVCLTFDDGFAGFHRYAWPLLREYGWPATLYLTTYYSLYNHPVFDPAVPYLLWKSRQRTLDWPPVLTDQVLLDRRGRAEAEAQIKAYCAARRLSGADKDELLRELARRLEVDLGGLSSRRIMHLLSPAEVRDLASQGLDVQLHTHTHSTMREREQCHREIQENRGHIAAMTGTMPEHLSYPNGVHFPELRAWLRECGILSASTTEPGLSTAATDAWVLPRFLDGCPVTRVEFEG